MSDFRVIQGCPANKLVAPYFYMLVRRTGATVNSIYRGDDAASILHAHGKHTQRELYNTLPAGQANPPGRSTHELRSDGVAYAGPIGRHLVWWQQGIDVNDSDVHNMMAAAREHGWELFQPYQAGVEYHHLNFKSQPRPRAHSTELKLLWYRARLPRK